MNKGRLICESVILLEIAAAAALLQGFPAQAQATHLFLFAHGAASLSLAMTAAQHALANGAPAGERRLACGLFFFCIAFFIPVIGAWISLRFLGRPVPFIAPQACTPIVLTGAPCLTNESATGEQTPPARSAQADLPGVLSQARQKERRLAALIAARELPGREAITLARRALTDREDEVRLLAYTLLSLQEEKIQRRIQALGNQLAAAEPDHRPLYHKALAHSHWEAVYLGLSNGAMGSFALDCALEHVDAALRLTPLDPGLRLLLGRILMRQGKLDQSALAFNQATELGIDSSKVAPFLDEIALMQARAVPRREAIPDVDADRNSADIVAEAGVKNLAHAEYRAAS